MVTRCTSFISQTETPRFPHSREPSVSTCYVEKLPVELLAEIFVLCLPISPSQPNPVSQQTQLCRVCSHWRRVAVSTPILWASADIETHSACGPHYAALVKLWLERSQIYPLTLKALPSLDAGADSISIDPVFAQLLAHIDRWHHVNLYMRGCFAMEQLLATPVTRDTTLESLEVDAYNCNPEQTQRLTIMLRSFSRLRRLTYKSDAMTSLLSIPWGRLTHIELGCPVPMDECVAILDQCVGIVDLFMWNIVVPLGPVTPCKTILADLVSCRLQSSWDVGAILVHFICPKLHTLSIMQDPDDRDVYLLNLFLTQSRCALKCLIFHDEWSSEMELAGYLAMPSLQSLIELEIFCYNLSDRTVDFLTGKGDYTALPHLKSIRLKHCSSSDGKLANMIASRWIAGESLPPLELISVGFHLLTLEGYPIPCETGTGRQSILESHEQDIDRFQHFSDEGLDVSWNSKLPY